MTKNREHVVSGNALQKMPKRYKWQAELAAIAKEREILRQERHNINYDIIRIQHLTDFIYLEIPFMLTDRKAAAENELTSLQKEYNVLVDRRLQIRGRLKDFAHVRMSTEIKILLFRSVPIIRFKNVEDGICATVYTMCTEVRYFIQGFMDAVVWIDYWREAYNFKGILARLDNEKLHTLLHILMSGVRGLKEETILYVTINQCVDDGGDGIVLRKDLLRAIECLLRGLREKKQNNVELKFVRLVCILFR